MRRLATMVAALALTVGGCASNSSRPRPTGAQIAAVILQGMAAGGAYARPTPPPATHAAPTGNVWRYAQAPCLYGVNPFTRYPYASNAPTIVADDGTYLGKLSGDRYDRESIGNPYSVYGDKYSQKNIFNEYSPYSLKYNSHRLMVVCP